MTENPSEQPEQQEPQTPPPVSEPVSEPTVSEPGPAFSPEEVNEGKVFAILSYARSFVSLPFFLVPLIMRNNEFALFHAKQSLMIWLAGIAVSVVGTILSVICIGFVILLAGGIFLLVLNVMGLIYAVQGNAQPLPLIGVWGVDWFKGITKVG